MFFLKVLAEDVVVAFYLLDGFGQLFFADFEHELAQLMHVLIVGAVFAEVVLLGAGKVDFGHELFGGLLFFGEFAAGLNFLHWDGFFYKTIYR